MMYFVSIPVDVLQFDDDMIWCLGIKGNIGCGLNVCNSALRVISLCGVFAASICATVFVFIFPFLYIIKQLVFSECSSKVRFAFLFVVDIDYIISLLFVNW